MLDNKQQVSGRRQLTYYGGMLLTALGLVLFITAVFSFTGDTSDFAGFEANTRSTAGRAIGGMVLLVAGAVLRRLGARGLAGSGALLDPEQARRDLEPYSRQAGGMLKDALDEAGLRRGEGPEKVIMVKCPACTKLNEADSNFCQECGRTL